MESLCVLEVFARPCKNARRSGFGWLVIGNRRGGTRFWDASGMDEHIRLEELRALVSQK